MIILLKSGCRVTSTKLVIMAFLGAVLELQENSFELPSLEGHVLHGLCIIPRLYLGANYRWHILAVLLCAIKEL